MKKISAAGRKRHRGNYTVELKLEAEMMFVDEGLPIAEVAKRLLISEATLRGWAKKSDPDWYSRKIDTLRTRIRVRDSLNKIRMNIAKAAENDSSLENINLFLSVEKMAHRAETPISNPSEFDRAKVFLEHFRFIIDILKERQPDTIPVIADLFDVIVDDYKKTLI